jgi:predicted membrane GTPase involved in stress response
MRPLFEMIKDEIPAPDGDGDQSLQLQITTLDYDDYVGRVGIGRIKNGALRAGQVVALCKRDGAMETLKIGKLWSYEGLKRQEVELASVGEIVALAGLGQVNIGETVSDAENPAPMPLLSIDEPTLTMTFAVNDSPFAGREGRYVTSRHLRQIVGEHARENDIDVNVCKKKHLTNMRASTSDEAVRLTPPRELSLEQALEYIEDDELMEVTPTAIRMRKKILDRNERARAEKKAASTE